LDPFYFPLDASDDAPAAGEADNCPKVQGPDWDIPGSLILRDLGAGQRVLIVGTKPGDILALDPDKGGALVWRKSINGGPLALDGPGYPGGVRAGVQWGGAADAGSVYYGLTNGGAAAMSLATGERRWFSPLNRAAGRRVDHAAAATVIPGAAFIGGSDGKLFAVSTGDGHELWSFDTAQRFDTVNKVPARGGGLGSAGPTVADGMLFAGSGYAVVGDKLGNVLLAFAPE
jgi:polyvinyl alcohol dehydrogenase (cytochrome)